MLPAPALRRQLGQQQIDRALQAVGIRGEIMRQRIEPFGDLAGLGRGLRHLGHRVGDLLGAARGALQALADLRGRGVLLLDRARDRGGDAVDVGDRLGDVVHRLDHLARSLADRRHLAVDLLGRLAGLGGERLDLLRHDREAAAGFAGARRLDGGVEREQVGLVRDRRDQARRSRRSAWCWWQALRPCFSASAGARRGVVGDAS